MGNEYVTIKLPRILIDEIDKILDKKGFKSRAEFIKEAVRLRLEQLEPKRKEASEG
ncbi:ribbon-helix-helix protein, CopG family [Candidatus Bathyarchaeota archaeon]|nr:ribbon-helix-helix protein, CopG family [Candidatus Bathyarchaeota archaeon]